MRIDASDALWRSVSDPDGIVGERDALRALFLVIVLAKGSGIVAAIRRYWRSIRSSAGSCSAEPQSAPNATRGATVYGMFGMPN
jgi:hypothetical protein